MAKKSTKAKRGSSTRNSNNSLMSSSINWKDWKIVVPVLLVFAVLGGYFVFSSFAASPYSFTRSPGKNPRQILGGRDRGKQVNISKSTENANVAVSNRELNNTRKICTTIVFNQTTYGHVGLSQSSRGLQSTPTREWKQGKRVRLCGVKGSTTSARVWIAFYPYSNPPRQYLNETQLKNHSIGVLSVWGCTSAGASSCTNSY